VTQERILGISWPDWRKRTKASLLKLGGRFVTARNVDVAAKYEKVEVREA
jgi:hypothetical protein